MTGFRPKAIRTLWQNRRRPPSPIERKVARELDPRPIACDCGRTDFSPDTNGHSWSCPCGLRY